MNIKLVSAIVVLTLIGSACTAEKQPLVFKKKVDIKGIAPIGLVEHNGKIVLSDGDHNRVVSIDENGSIVETLGEFQRPMHIDIQEGAILVPAYGSDTIFELKGGVKSSWTVGEPLDAPAAATQRGKEKAIADFYNHRVLFYTGSEWMSIGSKGKEKGQLHYPTDVQITAESIVVADAYNHRVQIFDKKGNVLQVIGEAEKMNASTGILVDQNLLYVTDFENDRILIYNMDGTLFQIIDEHLEKPTDLIYYNDQLIVSNYKGQFLTVFE